MISSVQTNNAFQAQHGKMVFFVPSGISVIVKMSADNENYEAIGTEITGPETVQINDIKIATWFKLESASTADIKITL